MFCIIIITGKIFLPGYSNTLVLVFIIIIL